jgi:hypothetical protein
MATGGGGYREKSDETGMARVVYVSWARRYTEQARHVRAMNGLPERGSHRTDAANRLAVAEHSRRKPVKFSA